MPDQVREVDVSEVPSVIPVDLVVLDVRERDEWEAGHIEGATHVPMRLVPGRFHEFPEDRRVLVVCRMGSRSAQVTGFLTAQGRDAVNLSGGMLAWQAEARPLTSETVAEPDII